MSRPSLRAAQQTDRPSINPSRARPSWADRRAAEDRAIGPFWRGSSEEILYLDSLPILRRQGLVVYPKGTSESSKRNFRGQIFYDTRHRDASSQHRGEFFPYQLRLPAGCCNEYFVGFGCRETFTVRRENRSRLRYSRLDDRGTINRWRNRLNARDDQKDEPSEREEVRFKCRGSLVWYSVSFLKYERWMLSLVPKGR